MSAIEGKLAEATMPPRAGDGAIAARLNRVKEHLADEAERRVHHVKRMARNGRFAIEDGVGGVTLRVRKNPGKALAIAFAAGTLVGALVNFAVGRRCAEE